jgi:hypothetical protein
MHLEAVEAYRTWGKCGLSQTGTSAGCRTRSAWCASIAEELLALSSGDTIAASVGRSSVTIARATLSRGNLSADPESSRAACAALVLPERRSTLTAWSSRARRLQGGEQQAMLEHRPSPQARPTEGPQAAATATTIMTAPMVATQAAALQATAQRAVPWTSPQPVLRPWTSTTAAGGEMLMGQAPPHLALERRRR